MARRLGSGPFIWFSGSGQGRRRGRRGARAHHGLPAQGAGPDCRVVGELALAPVPGDGARGGRNRDGARGRRSGNLYDALHDARRGRLGRVRGDDRPRDERRRGDGSDDRPAAVVMPRRRRRRRTVAGELRPRRRTVAAGPCGCGRGAGRDMPGDGRMKAPPAGPGPCPGGAARAAEERPSARAEAATAAALASSVARRWRRGDVRAVFGVMVRPREKRLGAGKSGAHGTSVSPRTPGKARLSVPNRFWKSLNCHEKQRKDDRIALRRRA